MNYYEELGIRPDADEEEIRKAHRRLVKLMHPDQHRDASLKALAETQMRRLNSIVATLLDPEEREEYDEELRGGGSETAKQAQPQSNWRAVPWWIASTLGAIILTVGTLWFFADRMGPTKNIHPPPDISETTTSTAPAHIDDDHSGDATVPKPKETLPETVPEPPKEVAKVPETPKPEAPKVELPKMIAVAKPAPLPPPPPARPKSPEVAAKPPVKSPVPVQHPVVATTEKPKVFKDVPTIPDATPTPRKDPELMASGAPTVAPPTPVGDIPRPEYRTPPPPSVPIVRKKSGDPLEGEWVYAPTEPEKHKAGFYPPEFIQLKLVKDTTGMRGEYSARYDVDKSVSPDVNFVLIATDATGTKYQWRAANGAHGWLKIKDLESDTMRLEWKDTSKHNGQQLTSGQAQLVRKN